MRVLLAVHQFFPEYYFGSERFVLNLCHQLQRIGHTVAVLTYSDTPRYEYQDVPVITVSHKVAPPDERFTIFDSEIEALTDRVIEDYRPDVVHVCHPMRIGSVIRSAKQHNIPIILTLTDFWLICPKGIATKKNGGLCLPIMDGSQCIKDCYGHLWKDRLIKRFNDTKEVFKSARFITSATNSVKYIFESTGLVDNVTLIRFGEDYSNVTPNKKVYTKTSNIIIGYMSALLPHKGAHILIDAFNKSHSKNVTLKIYGYDYDPYKNYQKQLSNKVKNDQKVIFCGLYNYEDMSTIFGKIDVLAIPSVWWENSPLVMVSALAHKVPVIASNVKGMTELIERSYGGFTFNVGKVNELSNIIHTISNDPTILNELKTFLIPPASIEDQTRYYINLYQSAYENKSA